MAWGVLRVLYATRATAPKTSVAVSRSAITTASRPGRVALAAAVRVNLLALDAAIHAALCFIDLSLDGIERGLQRQGGIAHGEGSGVGLQHLRVNALGMRCAPRAVVILRYGLLRPKTVFDRCRTAWVSEALRHRRRVRRPRWCGTGGPVNDFAAERRARPITLGHTRDSGGDWHSPQGDTSSGFQDDLAEIPPRESARPITVSGGDLSHRHGGRNSPGRKEGLLAADPQALRNCYSCRVVFR